MVLKLRESKEGVRGDPRAQKKMRFVNERHECFVGPFFRGRTAYMLPGYQTSPYRTYRFMVSDICPTDAGRHRSRDWNPILYVSTNPMIILNIMGSRSVSRLVMMMVG